MWFPGLEQSPLGDLGKKSHQKTLPDAKRQWSPDRPEKELGWEWRAMMAPWESENIPCVLGVWQVTHGLFWAAGGGGREAKWIGTFCRPSTRGERLAKPSSSPTGARAGRDRTSAFSGPLCLAG